MKRIAVFGGCCAVITLVSLLIFVLSTSSNKTLTYEVGTIKKKMTAFKNPYLNTVNKREGYWRMSDGCQIHYRIDGKGEPILVIHGGPGEPYKKPWEALRLINQKYSYIYYDQRGCGRSTRCIDRFSSYRWDDCQPKLAKKLGLDTALRDIDEIRRIIGVNKITIIGHSYGGVMAALYAVEFPDNIKKLVLVSPAPTIRFPLDPSYDYNKLIENELSPKMKKEFQSYLKNLWNFEYIIRKNEKELLHQNSYFFHFYDEYHKNIGLPQSVMLVDNLVDKKNIGGWLPYAYAWSLPKRFDYRSNLRTITAPALIIWGGKDLCQDSWIRQYSDNIPNSKTIKISDCGHFLFEEKPIEFSDAILDFLTKQ